MRVSATELKMNIGKFLAQAATEDIIITRNGKDIALITNVNNRRVDALKSLRGILKGIDMTHGEIREERLRRHDENPN
jgi:prevent-host-death family protein